MENFDTPQHLSVPHTFWTKKKIIIGILLVLAVALVAVYVVLMPEQKEMGPAEQRLSELAELETNENVSAEDRLEALSRLTGSDVGTRERLETLSGVNSSTN